MSGYTYGRTPKPAAGLLTIEQVRRRNAELNIELRAIAAEKVEISSRITAMRKELTTAHGQLRRQIRDLDLVRIQTDQIAAAARYVSTLPPPVHGGREGLQAATDEMLAHKDKRLKLSKAPRPLKGPSCGTKRKYEKGCRCDECRAWTKRRSAQMRTNQKLRLEAAA